MKICCQLMLDMALLVIVVNHAEGSTLAKPEGAERQRRTIEAAEARGADEDYLGAIDLLEAEAAREPLPPRGVADLAFSYLRAGNTMRAIALAKDEGAHQRIPAPGLVAVVHARFEQGADAQVLFLERFADLTRRHGGVRRRSSRSGWRSRGGSGRFG